MIIKFHNLRKLHSGSFGKHRCLWTIPLFSPFGEFAEILEIKKCSGSRDNLETNLPCHKCRAHRQQASGTLLITLQKRSHIISVQTG